jgi:hypothetical protein
MASYARLLPLVKSVCPFLRSTQAVNFTWLIVALLTRRTLCLTTLAKTFPRPTTRRTVAPKHELLHRLKRLSRFLSNDRIDPLALQVAFIPTVLAQLGSPGVIGLVLDWTSFDAKLLGLNGGGRRPYQVLTIAIPRRGRALPLLSVTYERDKLPAKGSQNKWEEEALAHVLRALPSGVRPVVLGDRGFGRAEFIAFLQKREIDYVVRLRRGARITAADDTHWLLGAEGTAQGEQRWLPQVRYGTFNNRPRALWINLACSWCPPAARRRDKTGKEYRNPGISLRASAICGRQWPGTANGCGSRRPSKTFTRALGWTPHASARPGGWDAWWPRSLSLSPGCTCWLCPNASGCPAAGRPPWSPTAGAPPSRSLSPGSTSTTAYLRRCSPCRLLRRTGYASACGPRLTTGAR